jgi:hypothetical protein
MNRSIWIILLDVSGSMANGFTGNVNAESFPGIAIESSHTTKIEEAKRTVLEQIRVLNDCDIALVPFREMPELIHLGTNADFVVFQNKINDLRAGGGTNIGKALLFVPRVVLKSREYNPISVLVISDGLDDIDAATSAARECIKSHPSMTISTVLIDHSSKGEELATSISVSCGGDVRLVYSRQGFQHAVTAERHGHQERVQALASATDQKRRVPAEQAKKRGRGIGCTTLAIIAIGILIIANFAR